MMEAFLLRALLGGLALAILAGPVGCFIVWRRMAYFGAAVAHAALLGVAAGLLLSLDPMIGVTAVCLISALILVVMERRAGLASDTLIGIIAHVALALGLVLAALLEGQRLDLMGYLFGDVLALRWVDVTGAWIAALIAVVVLLAIWRSLLAMTVNEDLAAAEGVPVERTRILFMLIVAGVVAVGMQVVGILLIVSLLILPPAAARAAARTPEMMAVLSVGIGAVSVVAGLAGSYWLDVPAGPAIVLAAGALFTASLIFGHGARYLAARRSD